MSQTWGTQLGRPLFCSFFFKLQMKKKGPESDSFRTGSISSFIYVADSAKLGKLATKKKRISQFCFAVFGVWAERRANKSAGQSTRKKRVNKKLSEIHPTWREWKAPLEYTHKKKEQGRRRRVADRPVARPITKGRNRARSAPTIEPTAAREPHTKWPHTHTQIILNATLIVDICTL